jgi:hypothetical protein
MHCRSGLTRAPSVIVITNITGQSVPICPTIDALFGSRAALNSLLAEERLRAAEREAEDEARHRLELL